MDEDHGAFKTNQAHLGLICRFVIGGGTVAPVHHGAEITSARRLPDSAAPIFTERRRGVRLFSNQPDSPQL
jgi:hypothetical protein